MLRRELKQGDVLTCWENWITFKSRDGLKIESVIHTTGTALSRLRDTYTCVEQ